jgi:hypothetical protein
VLLIDPAPVLSECIAKGKHLSSRFCAAELLAAELWARHEAALPTDRAAAEAALSDLRDVVAALALFDMLETLSRARRAQSVVNIALEQVARRKRVEMNRRIRARRERWTPAAPAAPAAPKRGRRGPWTLEAPSTSTASATPTGDSRRLPLFALRARTPGDEEQSN